MTIKKKLTVLLIGALAICLFFAFGFQIDVDAIISKDGGTADVSLTEPLRVAADEANTALEVAQLAADEANAAVVAAQLAADEANAAVVAAQLAESAAIVAEGLLIVPPATPKEKALAVQAVVDAQAVLLEAQTAAGVANTALLAAQQAADEANAAYLALIAKNEGDLLVLLALQQAADEANAALAAAEQTVLDLATANQAVLDAQAALAAAVTLKEIAAADKALQDALDAQADALALVATEVVIVELQLAADGANAALGVAISEEIKVSHIITNSNNGGLFTDAYGEGNHSGVNGETFNFTFESDPGFDLVWLRVGNTKFATTEEATQYIYNSDKKNLTIHAHFKKDKDYVPETTTVEGTSSDEGVPLGDEDGKDNGNGKDKEKSNNGKKNK